MRQREVLSFNPEVLSRKTALAGLLRGELAQKAGLCSLTITRAFAGKTLGVRAARQIAKALGCGVADLVTDESAALEVA